VGVLLASPPNKLTAVAEEVGVGSGGGGWPRKEERRRENNRAQHV